MRRATRGFCTRPESDKNKLLTGRYQWFTARNAGRSTCVIPDRRAFASAVPRSWFAIVARQRLDYRMTVANRVRARGTRKRGCSPRRSATWRPYRTARCSARAPAACMSRGLRPPRTAPERSGGHRRETAACCCCTRTTTRSVSPRSSRTQAGEQGTTATYVSCKTPVGFVVFRRRDCATPRAACDAAWPASALAVIRAAAGFCEGLRLLRARRAS